MGDAMTNAARECLSKKELRDYALGRLPDSRSESVASHLETCVTCEDTISSLDNTTDSLVDFLKLPPAVADNQSPEYRAAIQKMQGQRETKSIDDAAEPDATAVGHSAELIRDYKLLSVLGAGGMGTVYKAIHTKLDRIVALKLLPARRIGNAEAVARFEREMKAIGKLDHPAIVRATDAGEEDDQHFLAMEFVEGFDVSELIDRHGPMKVADACEVIRQAAIGLQHVHEQGLVHRDIKPSNLMVTPDGQVKILDLGLALLGEQQDGMDELTTVGQMMGTIDYMAPEQCDDSHVVDIRADIYSLGATLFKMITGSAPFATSIRRSPLSRIRALATEDAPLLSDRVKDVPDGLNQVVCRMLSRDPDDRMSTPEEVVTAMEECCPGHDLAMAVSTAAAAPAPRQKHLTAERAAPRPVAGETTPEAPSSNWYRAVKLLLGAGLVALAAIIFRLQTDKGELIVNCNVPGVEVKLLKDGKPHQEMSLKHGKTSLSVFSGNYEIQIPGQSDSVEVTANKFTITRGSKVVAEIRKVDDSVEDSDSEAGISVISPVPNGSMPLYSGRSFDEWRQQLADRDHTKMGEAMTAIGILGVNINADEAGRLIYDTVKHVFKHSSEMPTVAIGGAREPQMRKNAVQAFRPLLDDPEAVEVLRDLLTNGDTSARRFAICVLDCRESSPMSRAPGYRSAQRAIRNLVPAILAASYEEEFDVRSRALYPLYDLASSRSDIVERHVELLASDNYEELYNVALTLDGVAPRTRNKIGKRFLEFYESHRELFESLRREGQSQATLGEYSLSWMQVLHIAVECGADRQKTEYELLSILKDSNASAGDRTQAAFLLGKYPHKKPTVATELLKVLRSKEEDLSETCRIQNYELRRVQDQSKSRNSTTLQIVIVEALGNLGTDAKGAIDYLAGIVSLEHFGSRNISLGKTELLLIRTSVEALGKIGLNTKAYKALDRVAKELRMPFAGEAQKVLNKLSPEEREAFQQQAEEKLNARER